MPILSPEPKKAVARALTSNLTEAQIILSFDVEEHHRIEAAHGLSISPGLGEHYRTRLVHTTSWLLDTLARLKLRATFFVVGEVAEHSPALVRAIHHAGHEVASHGWAHHSVQRLTPGTFREDLRRSKDALEQVTGAKVIGFRAPTFSIVRQTAWAIDVLVEEGFLYDSSIYPVRHDRYGISRAPRAPFLAQGPHREILEIPPATLRLVTNNLPVGGGGYFRLLPLALLARAIRQIHRDCRPPLAMLYFHPWEFDPQQEQLPLKRLSRFRTYVGIRQNPVRLLSLLARYRFIRACEAAARLDPASHTLPRFRL
jgi:polysaccharide deacetylase family protein (PEP-CTERM system associated)